MNVKFAKAAAVAAVSVSAMVAFTACDETTAGAQGVAGVQGEQGEPGESCTAKKLKDGSGYELKCGGETVGTILNGEDGEDGSSCTAKKLSDGSGYELKCGGETVGTILNGEDGLQGIQGEPGKDGSSCTVADTAYTDENEVTRKGYKLLCADTLKGVVWNGLDGQKGEDGTNCTVADTTRKTTGQTGYKLLCDNKLKGVVWNGLDGEQGENCSVTALKDGSGYTLTCGDDVVTIKNGTSTGDALNKQFVFVPGSNVLKTVLASDLETGTGFKVWKGSFGTPAVYSGTTQMSWWYTYGDYSAEFLEGRDIELEEVSKISFPVEDFVYDNENKVPYTGGLTEEVVTTCGGACGNVVLGEWESLPGESYPHFAGIGIDFGGSSSVKKNLRAWKGVCLSYYVVGNIDHLMMFVYSDSKRVAKELPQMTELITLNIAWDEFSQETWVEDKVSNVMTDIIAKATNINMEFQGKQSQTASFNVTQFGPYGTCE